MPTQLPVRLTQAPAAKADQYRHGTHQPQSVSTQAVAHTDQRLCQPRQRLAAVDENLHYIRYHITQQKADDQHAGQHQDQRVHQGHLDLLPRGLPGLGVRGQLFQHMAQMTGAFAGSHGGAEQLRERRGKLRQCRGQRMAFHHPASDRGQQARDPAFGALFRHGIERLLQWQTGLHQRR
ncbi:hypothetical protein D3C76_1028090 [compost metagenome]